MIIGLFLADFADCSLDWAASVASEADKQELQPFFFDASGLDFTSHTVLGSFLVNGKWRQQRIPLPEAVVGFRTGASREQRPSVQDWLCRNVSFIAGDLPVDDEKLCLCLQQSPFLRTLLEPDEPGATPFRFRVRMSRMPSRVWAADGIDLETGAAYSPVDGERRQPEKELAPLLQAEFPESHMFVQTHLKQVASEVALAIESLTQLELPALHIELTIDRRQRTRFIGADTGPDSSGRLAGAFAYAARLAKAGYKPVRQPAVHDEAAFPYTIGLLIGWPLPGIFLDVCHHVASSHRARFFYFYPKWVDAGKQQILGSYWRAGKWEKAYFPYPDVIYDRMRRMNERNAPIYGALSSIPITHDLTFGSYDKVKVYREIALDEALSSAVIPFTLLDCPEQVSAFLDRHPGLILKPVRGSHGKNIITATQVDGHYEIFDQTYMHTMSRAEFEELLMLLGKQRYFAQQFVQSKTREGYAFHIRVHLMKDGSGNWRIVFIFPSFSLTPYNKITNHEKTFRGVTKWEWFVGVQFGEKLNGPVDRKVKAFAYAMADFLRSRLGDGFHEAGLDLGMDERGAIKLFEANLNNVGMNFHEYEAAKHGIEYALYLASGKARSNFNSNPRSV